jgi:hypothetical protein
MLRVSQVALSVTAMLTITSFGAVLEEFEVSDALMTVLAGKYSNGNPTPVV